MQELTVLYDDRCLPCRRARDWLERQPQLVRLKFVAAGSEEARFRFPALRHELTLDRLTAIGDGGEVYTDAKAWLMCLWALSEYRSAAHRLSSPKRMHRAERFVAWVSAHRGFGKALQHRA